jgi:hypothetical protein
MDEYKTLYIKPNNRITNCKIKYTELYKNTVNEEDIQKWCGNEDLLGCEYIDIMLEEPKQLNWGYGPTMPSRYYRIVIKTDSEIFGYVWYDPWSDPYYQQNNNNTMYLILKNKINLDKEYTISIDGNNTTSTTIKPKLNGDKYRYIKFTKKIVLKKKVLTKMEVKPCPCERHDKCSICSNEKCAMFSKSTSICAYCREKPEVISSLNKDEKGRLIDPVLSTPIPTCKCGKIFLGITQCGISQFTDKNHGIII